MDQPVRLNLITTAAVLSLGVAASLITSTVVAARAYRDRGTQAVAVARTISVKGSTRKPIRSDRAVWSVRVRGDGKEMAAAFEALESGAARVREFLEKRGFAPAEVGVGAIETEVHHARDAKGQETSETAGYTLDRAFFITTGEVERVSQAAGQVTELIRDGVFVISNPPAYTYTRLPELKVELMGLAAKDARSRADEIAQNAGCRVAEVRSAQMGVLQITRPNSTEVSGYGMYDTGTIEKDVTAVVTMEFGIVAP